VAHPLFGQSADRDKTLRVLGSAMTAVAVAIPRCKMTRDAFVKADRLRASTLLGSYRSATKEDGDKQGLSSWVGLRWAMGCADGLTESRQEEF